MQNGIWNVYTKRQKKKCLISSKWTWGFVCVFDNNEPSGHRSQSHYFTCLKRKKFTLIFHISLIFSHSFMFVKDFKMLCLMIICIVISSPFSVNLWTHTYRDKGILRRKEKATQKYFQTIQNDIMQRICPVHNFPPT